jgi:hypothetical protein
MRSSGIMLQVSENASFIAKSRHPFCPMHLAARGTSTCAARVNPILPQQRLPACPIPL